MARIANPKEIVDILYKQLQESGWDTILRGYVRSGEFREIFNFLLKEVDEGNRFTPQVKHLFNPFKYSPYQDTKVIFLGREPYSDIGVADGLAFSHPNSLSKELPLKVLHSKVTTEVYNRSYKKVSDLNTDLRVWAEQGILLLNTSLTTIINKEGRHKDLWQQFISYMIDMLNSEKEGLIYVIFGEEAAKFKEIIDEDKNTIIELAYPGTAGYTWDSKDVFNEINKILDENHKQTIVW